MYISRGENLDSVKIVLSDFVLVGSIYSKSIFSRIEGYTSFMFLLLFLTILIVGYFGLKRYKVKIIKDHNALLLKESVYDNNNKLVFNDQELLLLGLFITNSKLGNKTSLEELNKILGLESRPIETQKSQRHKLISSINAKYLTIANRKLIHSEKLEFDRRSNVYFIYHEDVEFISQFVS
jgi:hypothetical protein